MKKIQKIFIVLLMIILGIIAWKLNNFIKETPYFQTLYFKVSGNTSIDEEEIIKIADLKLSTNIFKINSSKIKKNILNFSWIKKVILKKKLPDTLIIQITERQPELLLNIESTGILAIDEEKIIFPLLKRKITKPIITGIKIKNQPLKTQQIEIVFSLLEKITSTNSTFLNHISEINITQIEEPLIYLTNGTQIKLSSNRQNTLSNFLINYEDIFSLPFKLEYVDLRFIDIIIKPMMIKQG